MTGPVYPLAPPSAEEVRAWLEAAAEARRARVERLVGVVAPATAEPSSPVGWRAWWTPIASAPSAEDRLRDGWRRAVVLRDRRDRVAVERSAVQAEVAAVVAQMTALHDGKRAAVAAIEGLASTAAEPAARDEARGRVHAWFADACAFIDAQEHLGIVRDAGIELDHLCGRLWTALDALARQEQAAATDAADDVTRGTAHRRFDGMEDSVRVLDDVVIRLRTAARGSRNWADRLPLVRRDDPDWDRAEAEITDTLDGRVVERWLARRRSGDAR